MYTGVVWGFENSSVRRMAFDAHGASRDAKISSSLRACKKPKNERNKRRVGKEGRKKEEGMKEMGGGKGKLQQTVDQWAGGRAGKSMNKHTEGDERHTVG